MAQLSHFTSMQPWQAPVANEGFLLHLMWWLEVRKLHYWLWNVLGLNVILLLLDCLFVYEFETLEGTVCRNVEGYCSRKFWGYLTVPL